MTSRERIQAVLNGKETDRLPIDFGGMRSTGISIKAYDKLKKYLGINADKPSVLYDVFQQLAQPDWEILEAFGGDVVQAHRLAPAFGIKIDKWRRITDRGIDMLVPQDYLPIEFADGSREIRNNGITIAKMPSEGNYFDLTFFPLADAENSLPEGYVFDEMSLEEADFIEKECKNLYYNTDKAILFPFGGNILEAGESDFGFQKFMELILLEPDFVRQWAEKRTDAYIRSLSLILPRIEKYIDIVQFGDDLGTQQSQLLSVKTYRDIIMPYHKRMFSFVRDKFPKLKVFLHSCGSIRPLIPSLIEAGVQILNPVQISANDMSPSSLKQQFGKDLIFWGGGCDMQHVVMNGSTEEIEKEVRKNIEIFSRGGGYVFNQVHNIQANVPAEKIAAIYRAAGLFNHR